MLTMATRGKQRFSASSYKGSDIVLDFACNPCSKEGNKVESINYCVECSEYFCLACTKQHNKFRGTSEHNVVNRTLAQMVGGGPQSSGPLPNELCREHHGEKLTTYCADHDVVLCNTCVSVDHRLCGGVSYIPKVAGGVIQSKDINKIKTEISESLKTVNQTKLSLHTCLTSADEEKKDHLKRIRDYTERLIKHARDLEKAAVDDVNGRHKTTADKLRSGIRSLDDAETTMKDRLKNLDNVQVNNDSQVFVDIKRGKQEVENARQLKQSLKPPAAGKTMPEFVVGEDVDYFLNNEVNSLGQYVEKKAYTAVLYDDYDVGVSEDTYVCHITGSCELSDGTIFITDFNNEYIKKIDKSFRVTKCLNIPPGPYDICETGQDQVAVTLTEKGKVQFVNVKGRLKLTRSFQVGERCRSIRCSRGELLVSCGGHPGNEQCKPEGPGFVGVYSMAGSLLRKLQLDCRGRQIFTQPRHITTTDNGNKLHIADRDGGVITVDRQGNVLSTFSDGLQSAYGVCTVTEDNILVCGFYSNNVLQIDTDGEMVTELLNEKDGIKKPWSVLFLRGSSRLAITQWDSDKIKVFKLMM